MLFPQVFDHRRHLISERTVLYELLAEKGASDGKAPSPHGFNAVDPGEGVHASRQDYRDLDEKFDHIVSVGMFEHVGYKNYRTYMEVVHKCLREEGLFLLHTIGKNFSDVTVDPWLGKYIFPNSVIPSMKQISASMEDLLFLEDLHNFGPYYDQTLMSWFGNFERNWDKLKTYYDDRFYRMWKYYLLSSAGSFRSRYLHVWQMLLSRKGVPGGCNPVS